MIRPVFTLTEASLIHFCIQSEMEGDSLTEADKETLEQAELKLRRLLSTTRSSRV